MPRLWRLQLACRIADRYFDPLPLFQTRQVSLYLKCGCHTFSSWLPFWNRGEEARVLHPLAVTLDHLALPLLIETLVVESTAALLVGVLARTRAAL